MHAEVCRLNVCFEWIIGVFL